MMIKEHIAKKNYTNAYWKNYPSDDEQLSKFENYEITIPSTKSEEGINESEKFGFRPRFIRKSNNETTVASQHFVVDDGFEDIWGYSYQAEIAVRTYFPMIFATIIPFFSLFQTLLPLLFRANEYYNGKMLGIIRKQDDENEYLLDLIRRFKFNMSMFTQSDIQYQQRQ